MIAVSIQFSNLFQPPLHLALLVPTIDFDVAKEFAVAYMQKYFPAAVNMTFHFMRSDWQFKNEMMYTQESKAFSLN